MNDIFYSESFNFSPAAFILSTWGIITRVFLFHAALYLWWLPHTGMLYSIYYNNTLYLSISRLPVVRTVVGKVFLCCCESLDFMIHLLDMIWLDLGTFSFLVYLFLFSTGTSLYQNKYLHYAIFLLWLINNMFSLPPSCVNALYMIWHFMHGCIAWCHRYPTCISTVDLYVYVWHSFPFFF